MDYTVPLNPILPRCTVGVETVVAAVYPFKPYFAPLPVGVETVVAASVVDPK